MNQPLPQWVGAIIGVASLAILITIAVVATRMKAKRREARAREINQVLNGFASGALTQEQADKALTQLQLSQDELRQVMFSPPRQGLPIPWYGVPDEIEDRLKGKKP